ncbi:dipeptidyl carboxypeptidase II [Paludibacterium paludis]|uniref:Dipeptidyl carboxypeptidase II n=2 Tax=Paludibacterium paludis TaxID=1225769 RepID=A0A918NX43_9NEIS|nr:dipeptidyl carboxypeptidase II [Paludibacterium paludis]
MIGETGIGNSVYNAFVITSAHNLAMSDTIHNPLLQPWDTPYGLPPFDRVKPEHFIPAFDVALAEHRREIDAIGAHPDAPTFGNTLAAFDASGRRFKRIALLFDNLTGSVNPPPLQAVQLTMAPRLAAHSNAIYLHQALFARIDALYKQRAKLALTAEEFRLLEVVHQDFVRAGARLPETDRARLAAIKERLAELTTRFDQNVLGDETSFQLVLSGEEELAGLPDFVRDAARSAAQERGVEGWLITLSRSLVMPFLAYSSRRDLRKAAFEGWSRRGEHPGERDNAPLAREILVLRKELATLLGYASYADFSIEANMAGTPQAAADLMRQAWEPAKQKARDEAAELAAMAARLGEPADIQPWDWQYLAEKVRLERYDLDDSEIKPYFSLERMIDAMFDAAGRLFGVSFTEKTGVPLYHPDARLWEVHRDGRLIALFIGDNFARANKSGGAWMSLFREQSRLGGERVVPIVVNNNNLARAPEGQPTLMSADDVRTLFHEFGHGLHGMLSDVTFEQLSGPNVLRDFVELPSQIFENWAFNRDLLKKHARHVKTGEPIPDALLDRMEAARRFNQGFETVEYLASGLLDLALHQHPDPSGLDLAAFEREELARIGMPPAITPRHRLPHFRHVFSGPYYAAGYYVYLWAQVLDADGYAAFEEAGDPFDAETAERLYRFIYRIGNSQDPALAYRAFRGRDPQVRPMLIARGLIEA